MTKAIMWVSMHDMLPKGTIVEGELIDSYGGDMHWMKVKIPGSTIFRSVIVKLLKEKRKKKNGFVATQKLRNSEQET